MAIVLGWVRPPSAASRSNRAIARSPAPGASAMAVGRRKAFARFPDDSHRAVSSFMTNR
jgi:hypothetical protein